MSNDWLLTRRLNQEVKDSLENDLPGIFFAPEGDNLMNWEGSVEGPEGSIYAGIKVDVSLELLKSYPLQAPIMKAPGLFHPNVYPGAGQICMSLLHNGDDVTGYEKRCERWLPLKGIRQCFLSFQRLLVDPNPESPANPTAARMFVASKEKFQERVQNDYLKKTQEDEYKKCSKIDEIKSRKRKKLVSDKEPKKAISEKERDNFFSLLPVEPQLTSGGIPMRFRTPSKMYSRNFASQNLVISAFDFLGSVGIIADSITEFSVGKIDRKKAEANTFLVLNITKGVTFNVELWDEDDEADGED